MKQEQKWRATVMQDCLHLLEKQLLGPDVERGQIISTYQDGGARLSVRHIGDALREEPS